MKITKLNIAILLAVIAVFVSPVFGESESTEQVTASTSDCNLPAEFVNPEAMANTMANPAKFMQLMNLMSQPQFSQQMMACSVDSNQWNVWMASMSNPASMTNAMMPFMNPQTYMNWMTASMNPQTYTVMMMPFMNPNYYAQWMTVTMNPDFYRPMVQMMDMNEYTKMFESMYKLPVVADASAAAK